MRIKAFLYGFLLTLLSISLSQAATYYVATTGSNAVSCATAENVNTPKQTIANVRACATAPGDIVSIRAGTYNESVGDHTGTFGTGTNFGAGAITYRKHVGDGPVIWKTTGSKDLTVTPDNRNSVALFLRQSTSRYIIFEAITFDGNARIGNPVTVTGGWGSDGAHHTRFQSCNFQNSHSEISVSHSYGNEFIGGSIHDNGDGTNQRHGIYFSSEAHDNIVDSMNVYNNTGYGIHVWTGAAAMANRNIFRNNRVYNNGTAQGQCGIIYSGGDDGQVYNNLVYANGGGGICVAHSGVSQRTLVYNNTIVGNLGQSGFYGLYDLSSTSIIRNNILYQNGNGDRNSWSGGIVQSNNLIGVNPIFVNAGTRDYHLQAGSPAINYGITIPGFSTDHDGTPWGATPEAGGYNYGTAVAPNVLVFVSPPGTTVVNVTMATVTVCAEDSAGARQTGFADNISLAIGTDANPTTVLTGGTGGAPTSGCRSFSGLSLNKAGVGYKLTAMAGDLEKDSGLFNSIVEPTAPSQLRTVRIP